MTETMSLSDFWTLFGDAFIASLVAAALCGCLGFFVITRRIAFVSAALGNVSGLGVAVGFVLGVLVGVNPHQRTPLWLDPVVIALILSAISAAALSYVSRVKRTSAESVVAFAYLSASALALIVLASPLIVQEAHEVGDLLFGIAVAVRREHLVELGAVAIVVWLALAFLFKDLVFVSFDPEMARTLGYPVAKLDLLLHLFIGFAVTVSTRALGALPVFAFLVLPAGAALLVMSSIRAVVIFAIVGSMVSAAAAFYVSVQTQWPLGPTMALASAVYWPIAGVVRLAQRRR